MSLRLGELCAGYNGLGMAIEEVFGGTPAWFSEYDAAPSKILAHHYPDVPNYGDMTKIDWAAIEPVDIISGGTPCQDLSNAGKMRGMTEGTRSNLWVQMREAIAIQRPKYVVWENVRGAYSATAASSLEQCPGCLGDAADRGAVLRALGRVLGDLSDLGFDTEWRGLRAADVGACHGRFRVFVLAANRDHLGINRTRERAEQDRRGQSANRRVAVSNPSSSGLALGRPRRIAPGENPGATIIRDPSSTANSDDTRASRLEGRRRETEGTPTGLRPRADDDIRPVNWGAYAPAIRRWEAVVGRRSPAPTEPTGRNGGHRLSPRFAEWMMGADDGWITSPAIGLTRNDQLKACGNGVVPQQAIAALRDMLAAFNHQEQP